MADVVLPPDFCWSQDEPDSIEHRVSGKLGSFSLVKKVGGLAQGEVDYLVYKIRREYRRDRLYLTVGRNIERFRACQLALRKRGYWF